MRKHLEEIFDKLGLEIVDEDFKDDNYSPTGYIVVKNGDKFLRINFYEDSYSDGYISEIKEVKPVTVQKVEYE